MNLNNTHEEPTAEQWRELGSAEANAWTITPPGGQPMSLDEHAKYQEQQAKEREENLKIMREAMDQEAAERAEGPPSSHTP